LAQIQELLIVYEAEVQLPVNDGQVLQLNLHLRLIRPRLSDKPHKLDLFFSQLFIEVLLLITLVVLLPHSQRLGFLHRESLQVDVVDGFLLLRGDLHEHHLLAEVFTLLPNHIPVFVKIII